MSYSTDPKHNWYQKLIRHPKYRWWIIGASLLYLISPIDLVPDLIPIFGWIDDGVIATLLVAEISQMLLARLQSEKKNNYAQSSPTGTQSPTDDTVVDVDTVSVK